MSSSDDLFECPVIGCKEDVRRLQWKHFRYKHGMEVWEWVSKEYGSLIRKRMENEDTHHDVASDLPVYIKPSIIEKVSSSLDIGRDTIVNSDIASDLDIDQEMRDFLWDYFDIFTFGPTSNNNRHIHLDPDGENTPASTMCNMEEKYDSNVRNKEGSNITRGWFPFCSLCVAGFILENDDVPEDIRESYIDSDSITIE